MQTQYLTVSALNQYLKVKLENDPHLKKIYLKAEISNFKHHQTGHLYFSLKDEKSQLSAMMFSSNVRTLNFKPKDGDKVLVEGYISFYDVRGSVSIIATSISLDGVGDLYLKYEQLKKQFFELGYFDDSLKKPVPAFPKAIGVITSETGAVIQDIKTTVERRYLLTKIILYPAIVQGENSKNDLVRRIQQANLDNEVDVIILGRGGGSIEDLWSFNEAEVVVAIHQSKIPIITAIGHETDTTLSDYVSDLRAPTPTAAAELATPNTIDLINYIKEQSRLSSYYINEKLKNLSLSLLNLDERLSLSTPDKKLENIIDKQIDLKSKLNRNFKVYLSNLEYDLKLLMQKNTPPREKIVLYNNKITELTNKLNKNYETLTMVKTNKLNQVFEQIKGLNPLSIMSRGFALTKKNQKVVTTINDINIDDILDIELKDGKIQSRVLNKEVKENE